MQSRSAALKFDLAICDPYAFGCPYPSPQQLLDE
jgi:hypothetical protein